MDASSLHNDLESKFTPEQIATIKKYWFKNPPSCCKGVCEIVGFLSVGCKKCEWHEEEYIDNTENY